LLAAVEGAAVPGRQVPARRAFAPKPRRRRRTDRGVRDHARLKRFDPDGSATGPYRWSKKPASRCCPRAARHLRFVRCPSWSKPDHRDSVLDEDERQANDCMMICVSRACSARLTLDL
jgi:hypothetical protein